VVGVLVDVLVDEVDVVDVEVVEVEIEVVTVIGAVKV
jgi:hypothetical protein